MTSEAATVTAIYQGDADLREQIRTLIATDKRLSQAVVAKESGIHPSTFNQWVQGKYPGDNESLDTKVRLWLEADMARRGAGDIMPATPGFVGTPTAARVLATLAYAQMAGDITIAYGGAGLGKTSACEHYQSANPNVWLTTMRPSCATLVPMLKRICKALGIKTGGGAEDLMEDIVKRVRKTNGLLILDEAQHLTVQSLDQVRSIYDEVGIGIALVGNEGVFTRLSGGRDAQKLDRLSSRIGKRLSLKQSTEADVLTLVKAWGIADEKCHKTLIEIARGPGALRTLTKTLRLASMNAAAEGRGVCCQDVRAAAQDLMGVER